MNATAQPTLRISASRKDHGLDPKNISFLGIDETNFDEQNAAHLVYDVPTKGFYDVMGYNGDKNDQPGMHYVLLEWAYDDEDADLPDSDRDTTCTHAKYYPTFDAALLALTKRLQSPRAFQ